MIEVEILDTKTGEKAVHREGFDYAKAWNEDGILPEDAKVHGFSYQWGQGNYSCDCNRALFHSRALGRDDLDVDCNSGPNRFIIISVTEDGKPLGEDLENWINET